MVNRPLHASKQHFIKSLVISWLMLMVADGGFILIPSNWRSGYVLLLSLIMMADIFILIKPNQLLDKERRIRSIWILFGIANLGVALAFVFFEFSPGITLGGMMGILQVSSVLTSFVLIQYLKNEILFFEI
jgi:hypothetical protein